MLRFNQLPMERCLRFSESNSSRSDRRPSTRPSSLSVKLRQMEFSGGRRDVIIAARHLPPLQVKAAASPAPHADTTGFILVSNRQAHPFVPAAEADPTPRPKPRRVFGSIRSLVLHQFHFAPPCVSVRLLKISCRPTD